MTEQPKNWVLITPEQLAAIQVFLDRLREADEIASKGANGYLTPAGATIQFEDDDTLSARIARDGDSWFVVIEDE
jgi:hypothetical protein